MTAALAPPAQFPALYPPTVEAPPRPLPLRRFLLTFVRNPLSSLPRPVYEEPIVVHDNGRGGIAWVTAPELVEKVLLQASPQFPKSQLEKRVFHRTLGDGILTSEGASWRWQRRIAAPLFRPADLASLVPAMTTAAEDQIARWRARGAGAVCAIDRDMTLTTFRVHFGDDVCGQRRRGGDRHTRGVRSGALHHLLGHCGGNAECARMGMVPGQAQAPKGGGSIASGRGVDPGAPARRRSGRRRPAGPAGACARPRDRRADVGKAARRQSPDLPRRGPRDDRQGADLVALSARPRAAVAGAHLGRGRRGGRRRCRGRGAPRAPPDHARGAEGGHASVSAGSHHFTPCRRRRRVGWTDDQGRHVHRGPHFRGAPAQAAVGGPRPLRSRALHARARGQSTRARSSCRSASGRAPASAAPLR